MPSFDERAVRTEKRNVSQSLRSFIVHRLQHSMFKKRVTDGLDLLIKQASILEPSNSHSIITTSKASAQIKYLRFSNKF